MTYRERRRRSWRRYQRRKRAAALAKARQTRHTCPRRFGPHECGGRLETIVLRDGRTTLQCELCERFRLGICRDCPARVDGKIGWARRCVTCRHAARRDEVRRYRFDNPELEAQRQARYRATHREERRAADRARRQRRRLGVAA